MSGPSLVLLGALCRAALCDTEAPAPSTSPLLDRVAVVGASVSFGFGNGLPIAAVVQHALGAPPGTVLDASDGAQCFDPFGAGEEAVDRCLERRATLVVGVDFLFWYGYGAIVKRGRTEADVRLERLQRGLAELERLDCPLVIGDLPEFGANQRYLAPPAIPKPEVLDRLNAEIRAWAAARPRVLLVPLAECVDTLRAGRWVVAGSPDGVDRETRLTADDVLQSDRIHPTALGTLALVERLLPRLRERYGAAAERLHLDFWKAAAALKAVQAERRS